MAATSWFRGHPTTTSTPMNDHHFSYPVVVPLRGTTISGHAVHAQPPVALRPAQAPFRQTSAPPPKAATLAA